MKKQGENLRKCNLETNNSLKISFQNLVNLQFLLLS
jgi:hypothetical protein